MSTPNPNPNPFRGKKHFSIPLENGLSIEVVYTYSGIAYSGPRVTPPGPTKREVQLRVDGHPFVDLDSVELAVQIRDDAHPEQFK